MAKAQRKIVVCLTWGWSVRFLKLTWVWSLRILHIDRYVRLNKYLSNDLEKSNASIRETHWRILAWPLHEAEPSVTSNLHEYDHWVPYRSAEIRDWKVCIESPPYGKRSEWYCPESDMTLTRSWTQTNMSMVTQIPTVRQIYAFEKIAFEWASKVQMPLSGKPVDGYCLDLDMMLACRCPQTDISMVKLLPNG